MVTRAVDHLTLDDLVKQGVLLRIGNAGADVLIDISDRSKLVCLLNGEEDVDMRKT